MKILVANIGSTSFKYRLFDMADERQLARGGIERIGSPESRCFVEIGEARSEKTLKVPDHAEAIPDVLPTASDEAVAKVPGGGVEERDDELARLQRLLGMADAGAQAEVEEEAEAAADEAEDLSLDADEAVDDSDADSKKDEEG